jgi:DNA primase
MIPQDTVNQILQAADIVEVVGEFVNLKKRGANMIACCPFHGEKTPSFSVSPAKGIYKCFGCGKGGDALRFVMDKMVGQKVQY